jgi:hypothetical protein
MPHLLLTSALLISLLAIVATAIGGCLGIARDLMVDEAVDTPESGLAAGDSAQSGPAQDFGLGLRHAANFARDPGSFRGSGSLNA